MKLIVCNWEKWQTYRADRGQPPWIKVHRRLLRNDEFLELTDAEKGQLLCMWLLAADTHGVIATSNRRQHDAKKVLKNVQKKCFLEKEININKFIDLGFVAWVDDIGGVNVTSDWRHDDANVTPTRRPRVVQSSTEKNIYAQNEQKCANANAQTQNEQKCATELLDVPRETKPATASTVVECFNVFWKKYPKKVDKQKAQQIWKSRKCDKHLDAIMADLEFRLANDWKAADKQYIMGPAVYLRNRRWEDERITSCVPAKPNGNGQSATPAQERTWRACWDKVHGGCGATWNSKKDNPSDACHWCNKFRSQRAGHASHTANVAVEPSISLSDLTRMAQQKAGAQESGVKKIEKTEKTNEGFKQIGDLLEGKR